MNIGRTSQTKMNQSDQTVINTEGTVNYRLHDGTQQVMEMYESGCFDRTTSSIYESGL